MNTVTEQGVKSKIASTTYNRIPGSTITICRLELANGFSVIGQSACVDEANFSKQHGERVAFENAMSQLWVLEGYLLKEDLYRAGLPKEAKAMTFGLAIAALKMGLKVARAGWNGKGMFLFLVPGSTFKVNRPPLLGIYPEGTEINYCPHIDMKTADSKIVPWLASQADMLAEDWSVVP